MPAHQNHTVKPWNGGGTEESTTHVCACAYMCVSGERGLYVCVCGGGHLHVNAFACVPVHAYM